MAKAKLGDTVRVPAPQNYDASPDAQQDLLQGVMAGLPPDDGYVTFTLATKDLVDAYNTPTSEDL